MISKFNCRLAGVGCVSSALWPLHFMPSRSQPHRQPLSLAPLSSSWHFIVAGHGTLVLALGTWHLAVNSQFKTFHIK
jgi:hypothetical protein